MSLGKNFPFSDDSPVTHCLFFFLLVWGGAGDLSTSGLSPFPLKCPVWLILLLQAGFSCALAMLEET